MNPKPSVCVAGDDELRRDSQRCVDSRKTEWPAATSLPGVRSLPLVTPGQQIEGIQAGAQCFRDFTAIVEVDHPDEDGVVGGGQCELDAAAGAASTNLGLPDQLSRVGI